MVAQIAPEQTTIDEIDLDAPEIPEGLSDEEAGRMYRNIRERLVGRTLVVAAHRAADQAEFEKKLHIS